MFDMDYPGHYMRRIKNVSLSIPCVVGPYTGIHCKLTLLSSQTRVSPHLCEVPHNCCKEDRYKNAYVPLPHDNRILKLYAATEAISTSNAQNDAGMFELNFRDERYLPFEYAGAVSRWRIELPIENNYFDLGTVSDLILHLNYMSREGGVLLREAAKECAQLHVPGDGLRYFDIKHELPDAWNQFDILQGAEEHKKQLSVRFNRQMFPYIPGIHQLNIQRIELFFKAPGADPSVHHVVEYYVGQTIGQLKDDKFDCELHSISCVASLEWPGYFHGVLELDFGHIKASEFTQLGVFRFQDDVGQIGNVYLFIGYNKQDV